MNILNQFSIKIKMLLIFTIPTLAFIYQATSSIEDTSFDLFEATQTNFLALITAELNSQLDKFRT